MLLLFSLFVVAAAVGCYCCSWLLWLLFIGVGVVPTVGDILFADAVADILVLFLGIVAVRYYCCCSLFSLMSV